MIAHLRGRDRKLELHGWTGQEAEWIAWSAFTAASSRGRSSVNTSIRSQPGPGAAFRQDID